MCDRIAAWRDERLAAVCAKTGQRYTAAAVNRPLASLRHLMHLAHEEWEALPSVPRVRLERESQGRLRWLTEVEIGAHRGACSKSKNPELLGLT